MIPRIPGLLLLACCGCVATPREELAAPRAAAQPKDAISETTDSIRAISPLPPGDPFDQAVEQLVNSLPNGFPERRLVVRVRDFRYENSKLQSPFSWFLREEFKLALADSGRFDVLVGSAFSDLEDEGVATIPESDLILRGRYDPSAREDGIVVYVELSVSSSSLPPKEGTTYPGKTIIPRHSIGPTPTMPNNREESRSNYQTYHQNVKRSRQDFRIRLDTADGNVLFRSGDQIPLLVESEEACHIMVVIHQSNGESVILFPNAFNSESFIPANQAVWIGSGKRVRPGCKSGFTIRAGPPYGLDVIEVVAFSKSASLQAEIENSSGAASRSVGPFKALPRGAYVEGARKSLRLNPASRLASNFIEITTVDAL